MDVVVAVVAFCSLIAGAALASAPANAAAAGPCPIEVAIKVTFHSDTVTLAQLSVKNVSPATITPPWRMTWQYPNGQRIQHLFGAGVDQVGSMVTVYSLPWHSAVPSGATFAQPTGFYAAGPPETPTEATFNGYSGCAVTLS